MSLFDDTFYIPDYDMDFKEGVYALEAWAQRHGVPLTSEKYLQLVAFLNAYELNTWSEDSIIVTSPDDNNVIAENFIGELCKSDPVIDKFLNDNKRNKAPGVTDGLEGIKELLIDEIEDLLNGYGDLCKGAFND